jgi:hypothetical protein
MEPRVLLHKEPNGYPIDMTEYRRVIGCLHYLLHSWSDLSFTVSVASRFMDRPTTMHQNALKKILCYLKGTIHFGMVYEKGDSADEVLIGFSDSDLAGDLSDERSTAGMSFYVNNCLVS